MAALEVIRSTGRSLFRARSFAAIAIGTLALGIGLSTAVFTVADALLLRKLPVLDQERLVVVWAEKRDGTMDHWPLGVAQAKELVRDSRAIASAAWVDFYGALPLPVIDGNNVSRLRRSLVSGNYFDVLGAAPLAGRALQPTDDVLGAAPVVVLSHSAWMRRFGGDASAIGRTITLQSDGVTYTIVGVMPAGLEYPTGTEFWAPLTPGRLRNAKDSAFAAIDLVARLAPSAAAANVRGELSSYFTRSNSSPWERDLRGVALGLPRVLLGDVRPAVLAFAAAAALLLLITCIDVANLLLVRGLARTGELAVRSALGAARIRLVGLLLAENAVLAVVGGIVGLGVAAVAVRGFLAFAPASMPLLDTVQLDARIFAAALGITSLAMLLFGAGPALIAAKTDLQATLRSGARETASRGSRVAREALVALQVALAVLVLSAAALIGRSLMKLQNAELAFDASRLLVAELGLNDTQYDSQDKQLTMLRALLDRLRNTPGIEAASPVVAIPYSGTAGWTGRAGIEGQSPAEAAHNPMFNMELVTPGYFDAFGLRPSRGRLLNDADRRGSQRVVVVSEKTASSYWPSQDPIGKRLLIGGRLQDGFTVVGVVPDTRYRDLRDARATVYYPLAQSIFPFAPTSLVIRARGSPAAAMPAVRGAILETAPGVVLVHGGPFEGYMEAPLALPRLNAFLLGVFAFAAAALAAVGLFGVMTTMVRQRTRELALRMAVGATARDIRGMVMGRASAIAGTGVVAGLAAALAVNRLLASLLYEVSATDAVTLGTVGVFLLAIAMAATWIPAFRSARIDPAIALRSDG